MHCSCQLVFWLSLHIIGVSLQWSMHRVKFLYFIKLLGLCCCAHKDVHGREFFWQLLWYSIFAIMYRSTALIWCYIHAVLPCSATNTAGVVSHGFAFCIANVVYNFILHVVLTHHAIQIWQQSIFNCASILLGYFIYSRFSLIWTSLIPILVYQNPQIYPCSLLEALINKAQIFIFVYLYKQCKIITHWKNCPFYVQVNSK